MITMFSYSIHTHPYTAKYVDLRNLPCIILLLGAESILDNKFNFEEMPFRKFHKWPLLHALKKTSYTVVTIPWGSPPHCLFLKAILSTRVFKKSFFHIKIIL